MSVVLFQSLAERLAAGQEVSSEKLSNFYTPRLKFGYFLKIYKSSSLDSVKSLSLFFVRKCILRDYISTSSSELKKLGGFIFNELGSLKQSGIVCNSFIGILGLLYKFYFCFRNEEVDLKKEFVKISNFFNSKTDHHSVQGLKIFQVLLSEFSVFSSSNIGKSYSFHLNCKSYFQKNFLTTIYKVCLSYFQKGLHVTEVLKVMLSFLSWDFDNSKTSLFELKKFQKKKFLFDIKTVKKLFLYPELHLTRQILLQLSYINLSLFLDNKHKMNYLQTLVVGLFGLFKKKTVFNEEDEDLIDCFNNLILSFKLKTFILDQNFSIMFLNAFKNLTMQVLKVKGDFVLNCLKTLFSSWNLLLLQSREITLGKITFPILTKLKESCYEIFQNFYQTYTMKIEEKKQEKNLLKLVSYMGRGAIKNSLKLIYAKQLNYRRTKILGYLISDSFKSQVPLIPREIIFYTNKKNCDGILFKIIEELLKKFTYSPEMIWFFNRLSVSYLMKARVEKTDTNPMIESFFNITTKSAQSMALRLLQILLKNIKKKECQKFILSVIKENKELSLFWVNTDMWKQLITLNPFQLDEMFIKILVLSDVYQKSDNYLEKILIPFLNIFNKLKDRNQFYKIIKMCYAIIGSISRKNIGKIFNLFIKKKIEKDFYVIVKMNKGEFILEVLRFYLLLFDSGSFIFTNEVKKHVYFHGMKTIVMIKDSLKEDKQVKFALKIFNHLNFEENLVDPNLNLNALRVTLQIVDEQLLKVPKLCKLYFSIILNVTKNQNAVINKLEKKEFEKVIKSLMQGISHNIKLIIKYSLETLEEMAKRKNKTNQIIYPVLQTIFKEIPMIEMNNDILEHISGTVLSLIMWDKEQFFRLIRNEKNPQRKECLKELLINKTEASNINITFKKNIITFLLKVRTI